MSFALSGANTLAANDGRALYSQAAAANNGKTASYVYMATGLTPGSTVVTAKFDAITSGTATFARRYITAIPL